MRKNIANRQFSIVSINPSHEFIKQLKYYIVLQAKRLAREMRSFGVMPVLGIGLSSLSFVLISMFIFQKLPSYGAYFFALMPVAANLLLIEKERNDFLNSIFTKRAFLFIRMIESTMIALPFSIFLSFRNEWSLAITAIVVCVLSVYLKTRRTFSYRIPSPFSKRPYEFTTGFRRNYLLITGLYLVSMFALKAHNFNLGIVSLYGVAIIAATFYNQLDPLFFVWVFSLSSREFLNLKAKTGFIYGLYLLAPIFIPLAIIYPERILLTLVVLIIAILAVLLAIFAAYTNFPGRLTLVQKFKFGFALLFPPALIYVVPDFYLKALEKVKEYLKC